MIQYVADFCLGFAVGALALIPAAFAYYVFWKDEP